MFKMTGAQRVVIIKFQFYPFIPSPVIDVLFQESDRDGTRFVGGAAWRTPSSDRRGSRTKRG